MFDLSGQVAVVTGASSGLGLQMSHGLAEHGAEIVMLARRKEKLEAAAAQVADRWGTKTHPVPCDVTDLDQIRAAVATTRQWCNDIDILVNNAGAGGVTPALEMTDEQWDWDIAVDLTGVFRMTREFARQMIATGQYGRIINIASMYGLVGNLAAPASAYHAAKGGVVNLTRALAAEWAPHGVTVNCLCPGYFETELTADTLATEEFQAHMTRTIPLGRHGKAGELNSALVFLAARESSMSPARSSPSTAATPVSDRLCSQAVSQPRRYAASASPRCASPRCASPTLAPPRCPSPTPAHPTPWCRQVPRSAAGHHGPLPRESTRRRLTGPAGRLLHVNHNDQLVADAERWAAQKRRRLDPDLISDLLDLVTKPDERAAQSWPPGSAEMLVIVRMPGDLGRALPDPALLQESLDTFWRFLRATGRMASGPAPPADLVKELRRALPRMQEARKSRASGAAIQALEAFGTEIGIPLDGAATVAEAQRRLDAIATAWNELPQEERLRRMPQLSLPSDHAVVSSDLARQVDALVDWIGDGRPVTATGVLTPAAAREAYADLGLHAWQRAYVAARDPSQAQPFASPEVDLIEERAAAAAIKRAGDCLALQRVWYAAVCTRRIDVGSTRATKGRDPEVDDLRRALIHVAAQARLCDPQARAAMVALLGEAARSPGGAIDLDQLRELAWQADEFGYRAHAEATTDPAVKRLLRKVAEEPLTEAVALFADTGMWRRTGSTLTLTDFGREANAMLLMAVEMRVFDDA